MAQKKGGDRARRQARQAKRARAEEQRALQQPQASDTKGKAQLATKPKDQAPKAKDNGKPGITARAKNYLGDVKAEMRRVVWPSKIELRNYSIAVICLLIVFGVAVWLVDTGVVAALVGYVGLRG